MKRIILILSLILTVGFISCSKEKEDNQYKFLKDKIETDGVNITKLEFYLTTDKNFDKMYEFIKNRKFDTGTFYHAVFIDNEQSANFSKYPITAMRFEKEQSKHIIATYQFHYGNKEFTYYEKNAWESVPKTK